MSLYSDLIFMTPHQRDEALDELRRMHASVEAKLNALDEPFMPATVGVPPLPPSAPAEAGAYLEDAA